MKNIKQQAAMFGLDARVALAIFGAISVITGAALYSAMKEAKLVAIITEMDNINKAVSQYYIDTGSYPPLETAGASFALKTEELITSSVSGWKGPYLALQDNEYPDDFSLAHPVYKMVGAIAGKDGDWSGSLYCYSNSTSCSVYICYIMSTIPEDIQKVLKLKIDGTTSASTGDFRYDNLFTCKRGMKYDKSLAPAAP
ncbi:MAG: hypothetical protein GY793_09940 [Proteobacteria bacterium]|nr:hypothetical protein [Pseudomonadota bacterium]